MSEVTILVDADACPVKDEIYKVAFRTKVPVLLVSNAYLRKPDSPLIGQIVVSEGFDAADNRIVEMAGAASIVITADILLADRALKTGAAVISPKGTEWDAGSIGGAVATRAIMADLRAGGDQIGGPKPFEARDRSRFLSTLDVVITRLRRQNR